MHGTVSFDNAKYKSVCNNSNCSNRDINSVYDFPAALGLGRVGRIGRVAVACHNFRRISLSSLAVHRCHKEVLISPHAQHGDVQARGCFVVMICLPMIESSF